LGTPPLLPLLPSQPPLLPLLLLLPPLLLAAAPGSLWVCRQQTEVLSASAQQQQQMWLQMWAPRGQQKRRTASNLAPTALQTETQSTPSAGPQTTDLLLLLLLLLLVLLVLLLCCRLVHQ
jgi:hypothetical protein